MVRDFASFLAQNASKASPVKEKAASLASKMSGVASKAGKAVTQGVKSAALLDKTKPFPKSFVKNAKMGVVGTAGALAAGKIISEHNKTTKQFDDLAKDEEARYKDFYTDSAANRARTLAKKAQEAGEKKPDSERLKIELARKTITLPKKLDDKKKAELDIAKSRMKSGKGTQTDKKNLAFAKKEYNY